MYLYLLENSLSKKYYIGVTDNVNRRLEEHNRKSNHFTGKGLGIWKLVGIRQFESEIVYKEEKRLKKAKNKNYIKWYFLNLQVSDHSSTGRASPS